MPDTDIFWASESTVLESSVYMGAAYQNMLAWHDGSEARVLALQKHGKMNYLPLLVRKIGHGMKEAYSAYGYGGFAGEVAFSEGDIEVMKQFLAEELIVDVFVRHSPFLANHQLWPDEMTELNRHTYAAALQPETSFDDYLKRQPQKLRWSVNFARRSGLEASFTRLSCCPVNRIEMFYTLYRELMQQKAVTQYYLFSEEFFVDHALLLGENCELAEITDPGSGQLIAAAFFLSDGSGWVHYHLSAARREAMKLQAMELLIASALFRYGRQGYRALHLGGGHLLNESDGLSRFKIKFSTGKLDFCCTRMVCDETAYKRERERTALKHPSYFLISDARNS